METTSLFTETQHFRQKWLWFLLIPIIVIMWWVFYQQIIVGIPFGTNPGPDSLVWGLFVVFGLGLPWLFYALRLTTNVGPEYLWIRFFPLSSRRIDYRDIDRFYAREYKPIAEYGGWGIRWSPDRGMAYNVSGKVGVQIHLKNGKQLLIGSQRSEELVLSLEKATGSSASLSL